MNEQTQDRAVVLAVVALLGIAGIVGLLGIIWLVDHGHDASSIAVVSTLTGTSIGALGTLLASTRSAPPPLVQAAQAQGYVEAVKDVKELGDTDVAPTPAPGRK